MISFLKLVSLLQWLLQPHHLQFAYLGLYYLGVLALVFLQHLADKIKLSS
jgi:hypothetical protein